MFDFFKEIINEANGLDIDVIKEQEKRKREEEKKARYIFSRKAKILIVVLLLLYLAIAILSCMNESIGILSKVKYILLSIIDLAIIFSLFVGKRKGDLIALIGLFVFLALLIISVMI